MSAFSAMTRSMMSRRFSSMSGLASWLGNVPSTSKQSRVVRQGRRSNSRGATMPADAVAGVEHDVERLDDRRVDERHHVLDVVVEHVASATACPASRPPAAGVPAGDHVADVADAGVAAERKRLAPHHLDAVVFLGVVRRGDLRAAVVAVARDGEVHHVGAHHAVVDDVGALRAGALDERGGHRRRRQPHVARHGDALRAADRLTKPRPICRARLLVDLGRIEAADVVGLEDRRC